MDTTTRLNGNDRERLLTAILAHVPFDGWGETAFRLASDDVGLDPGVARLLCPRGGVDLAADYHRRGDRQMVARLKAEDIGHLRFRDKVAAAVRLRIEQSDRELVRRAAGVYALPGQAALGAKLVWDTADQIWQSLGDSSDGLSWYTKRASLSAVYSATLLYWLGDESEQSRATWEFLGRRIDDVMTIEKAKRGFRASSLGKLLTKPLQRVEAVTASTSG